MDAREPRRETAEGSPTFVGRTGLGGNESGTPSCEPLQTSSSASERGSAA